MTPLLEDVPADAPAKTLRQWREELYMSQREFAEKLGVHHSAVNHWERGTRKPQLRTIRLLAERLGVKPQQIEVKR